MRALQLDGYRENLDEALSSLRVVKKPIPKPSHGQVLVKVEASPCNPSDLLLLQGKYGRKKPLPATPGWEGAGRVMESGGGLLGRWLLNKRVAFTAQSDGDGAWAEYCVIDAKNCISLIDEISFEQGSTLIINPLTALGLIDSANKGKHAAIIQTAAASQVGKMVAYLAHAKNLPAIHIVRRQDQEKQLRELGAKIILNSEALNFKENLKKEAERLNASLAFEAIGGTMTGFLLKQMPSHSKVLVYGSLSESNCSDISPIDLIFREKSIEGFYLGAWLKQKNIWELYQITKTVQRLFAKGAFHTRISSEVGLEEAPKALAAYVKEMSSGKVLIKPH